MRVQSLATRPDGPGWRRGLGVLFGMELGAWTRTRSWWLQPLVWLAILVGPLLTPLYLARDMFAAEPGGVLAAATEMFMTFAALAPAIGAVLVMHGVLIGERQLGTAAWVLSKPVSRAAFLLSKLAAHGLALLLAAMALPGLAAYALLSVEHGAPLPAAPWAAGLGLASLNVAFYAALTLALGAITNVRGVVLALPLAMLLGGELLLVLVPELARVTPWLLGRFAAGVAQGAAMPVLLPAVTTVGWGVAFVLVALRTFGREDL